MHNFPKSLNPQKHHCEIQKSKISDHAGSQKVVSDTKISFCSPHEYLYNFPKSLKPQKHHCEIQKSKIPDHAGSQKVVSDTKISFCSPHEYLYNFPKSLNPQKHHCEIQKSKIPDHAGNQKVVSDTKISFFAAHTNVCIDEPSAIYTDTRIAVKKKKTLLLALPLYIACFGKHVEYNNGADNILLWLTPTRVSILMLCTTMG